MRTTGRCRRLAAALALAVGLGGCGDPLTAILPIAGSQLIDSMSTPDAIPPEGDVIRVADRMRANGDLASAVVLYRRAYRLDPTSAEPLVKLGSALGELGDHEEAVKAYRAALRLERTNETLRGLGNELIKLDQPRYAMAQFEEALTLNHNDHLSYNGLGVSLDMLGEHQSAQTYYRRGLALAPGNVGLRNNLGLSLGLSGEYEEAIALLRDVAQTPSASARNRQNLALVYGLANRPDEAAKVARTDLGETEVRDNLTYYQMLKSLKDSSQIAGALGSHDAVAATEPAAGTPPPPPVASVALEPAIVGIAPRTRMASVEDDFDATDAPIDPDADALALIDRALGAPDILEDDVGAAPRHGGMSDAARQREPTAARPSEVAAAGPAQTPSPERSADLSGPVAPLDVPLNEPAFRAQLASYRSSARALLGWRELAGREPSLLAAMQPLVVEADLGARGVFYGLRTGRFGSRAEAVAFCVDARTRGLECLVKGRDGALPVDPQATSLVADASAAKGHRVQLASFRERARSLAAWTTLKARSPALLADLEPSIVAADLGDRGTFHGLRVGPFANGTDARERCAALKAAGQDCFAVADTLRAPMVAEKAEPALTVARADGEAVRSDAVSTPALPAAQAPADPTVSLAPATPAPVSAAITPGEPVAGPYRVRLGRSARASWAMTRWAQLTQSHPSLLNDLRPHLQGAGSDGEVELLAGPLPSAEAAGKVCLALAAKGQACDVVAPTAMPKPDPRPASAPARSDADPGKTAPFAPDPAAQAFARAVDEAASPAGAGVGADAAALGRIDAALAPRRQDVPTPEITQEPATGEAVVQLGAYRRTADAKRGWRLLLDAHGDLLKDMSPNLVATDLGPDRGRFVRLRVGGFDDINTARDLCAKLEARSTGCWVAAAQNEAEPAPAATWPSDWL